MLRIDDVLVPPRRLGGLLRESRVAAGEELADVASRSDRLTVDDLEDLENGRRTADDRVIAELIEIYALEGAELLPERSRLVIDLEEGLISVDATRVSVAEAPEPEAVLVRYLALVHRLRGVPVGTELSIRELDVEVLATALQLDDSEVERRLRRLVREGGPVLDGERQLRRRLVVPLAGVVVAATAVGVLLLVSDDAGEVDPGDADRVLVQVPDEQPTDPIGADRMVASDPAEPAPQQSPDPGERNPTPDDGSTEPTPAVQSEPTDTTPPVEAGPAPVAPAVETEIIDAAIVESGGEQTTRD